MKKYSKYTIMLPWFICLLGALFYSYEYFLRITPSVMSIQLIQHYHINDEQFGNLSAYYYYIYTPMQLFVGVLMDRYGPRRLLTIATLSCVLGAFLFAATPYIIVAEIGRLFVGFGSAFAFVGVLKLATIWLPRRYFAMFSGFATALGMLGAIAGDVALAQLVKLIGWQVTVMMSAGAGVILAILIGVFVRDHSQDRKKAQNVRALTLRDAFSGLYRIALTPQMWIIGLIGGLLYIPTSAFAELWGVQYLMQVHHFSNTEAALAISMIFWGWVFGGPLAGYLSDTLKNRRIPLTINGLVAAVLISIVIYTPSLNTLDTFVLLFIFGLFSAVQVVVFAMGKEINSSRVSATAIAFVNMAVMLSGVIFQPLIGYILDKRWSGVMVHGVQYFSQMDYQIALTVMPVGLVLAVIITRLFLKETYQEKSKKKAHLDSDMLNVDSA